MASIYSALIFDGHNIGSPVEIGLDPSYVWIIRDMDCFFPGPDAECELGVISQPTGATIWKAVSAAVDNPGQSLQWTGRQVLVPIAGEPTLTITSSAELNAPDLRISGYRLTPP